MADLRMVTTTAAARRLGSVRAALAANSPNSMPGSSAR